MLSDFLAARLASSHNIFLYKVLGLQQCATTAETQTEHQLLLLRLIVIL